ncbi:hypothetical protein Tco_0008035 [Tanacetum coccineum]
MRHGLYVTIVCYVLLAIVVDRGTRSVPFERDLHVVDVRPFCSLVCDVEHDRLNMVWCGCISLIPLSRGSFDVIVGMDWLSKRKFVIVYHEKVVRIPLEGNEILQVHGERTQGVVKTLNEHKATSVAKSPYRLAPFEIQELFEQLRELQDKVLEVPRKEKLYAKVTYLCFIANFSKFVKPLTPLTERNQKYKWGAEREETFQALKNDLCDASINQMQ